jgi:hypothetical protein
MQLTIIQMWLHHAPIDPRAQPPTIPIIQRQPTHMRQRKLRQTYQLAPDHYHSYGGNLHEKLDQALRIYSKNITGLTYTQNGEDYDYVHGTLNTMNIDVAGLSETNSPWTNHHLTDGYTSAVNRYAGISKTHFSSASSKIDPITPTTYHQSGRTATTVYGGWTTKIKKSVINDPTGLGRWSGVILGGKQNKQLAIITGYRVSNQSRTAAGENYILCKTMGILPRARHQISQSQATISNGSAVSLSFSNCKAMTSL